MKNDNEAPLPKIFPKLMHNFSTKHFHCTIKYWSVLKCQKVHFPLLSAYLSEPEKEQEVHLRNHCEFLMMQNL